MEKALQGKQTNRQDGMMKLELAEPKVQYTTHARDIYNNK